MISFYTVLASCPIVNSPPSGRNFLLGLRLAKVSEGNVHHKQDVVWKDTKYIPRTTSSNITFCSLWLVDAVHVGYMLSSDPGFYRLVTCNIMGDFSHIWCNSFFIFMLSMRDGAVNTCSEGCCSEYLWWGMVQWIPVVSDGAVNTCSEGCCSEYL